MLLPKHFVGVTNFGRKGTSVPKQISHVSDDVRRWYAANPAVHRTQGMLSLDRLRVSAGISRLNKAPASSSLALYLVDLVSKHTDGSVRSALRQWQHGLASEVVIEMHTLSQQAACAPAKAWTVSPRFLFEKSA